MVFLYDLALLILASLAVPRLLYQRLFNDRYKNGLGQKFGFGFPKVSKGDRKLLWVHAVSLGETKAVASLVRHLKKQYANPIVIVSSTTETGHKEAQKSIPLADHHLYLPFDFYWIIRPIVRRIRPDLVILTETDFWYNFLRSAKKAGATVALVNGKLSERSMSRFRFLKFFSKKLFEQIDLFCLQSEDYLDRFRSLDVPQKMITITGNLKFDDGSEALKPDELEEWKRNLGITPVDRVIVVGSTHEPEEQLVFDALKAVWRRVPNLKIILVPRHPERFGRVAELIEQNNLSFFRLSEIGKKRGGEQVILIDAMGLLRTCYQFADIAIVAGSYTEKIGGHNIIEPCSYRVPVVFGPHMQTQPDLVRLVEKYRAGLQVSAEKLPMQLIALLENDQLRKEYGEGGERLIAANQGATKRTLEAIANVCRFPLAGK